MSFTDSRKRVKRNIRYKMFGNVYYDQLDAGIGQRFDYNRPTVRSISPNATTPSATS